MSRIIAGSAKGRRLEAPRGATTRPTTDRTKEALFSSLASWFDTAAESPEDQLEGLVVLDLFAGSGALGLEAGSRGAASVTFVDPHTAPIIRDNARRAGLRMITVVPRRAEQVVPATDTSFDLVFMDPPYDVPIGNVNELLGSLVAHGVLAHEALVVVERSSRTDAPTWPAEFTTVWNRRYGESTLHFGATDQEQP